ncbi:MAG: phosphatase PAP2 family protein [Bryobacteraceae bacterium]|jgi:membrane-associated phospholipid phosphatase
MNADKAVLSYPRLSAFICGLRPHEWLFIGYFTYVAVVAGWYFTPWKAWLLAAIVATILAALSRTRSVFRDVFPLALMLTAYREMNWFAPNRYDHHLENGWVVWDHWLLNDNHVRAGIESLGALLPTYFELCYLLVYAVGSVALLLLFCNGSWNRVNLFWMVYLAGTLGAYALFPYFPSEPPRTVFATVDLPHIITVVRRFNLWILGGYSIHSSVFPSAHVSSAFSAAWALLVTVPQRKWIGGLMAFYAVSVAVATIYGRYHYAADAVAGLAVSFAGLVAINSYSPQDQKR